MKLSTLVLVTAGLCQRITAVSHDQVRALGKKLMNRHAIRLLSDISVDDDFSLIADGLSDGARECALATEDLHENNQELSDFYIDNDAGFDDDVCDGDPSSATVSCTFDFTDASTSLEAVCAAANGNVMTMDFSFACSGAVEGNTIAVDLTYLNIPQCLDGTCSGAELQEIMTAVADNLFRKLDQYDVGCTSSITVNDSSGKAVFSAEKKAGDDRSFLEIAQSKAGTSGTAKLATSGLAAAVVLFAAAI